MTPFQHSRHRMRQSSIFWYLFIILASLHALISVCSEDHEFIHRSRTEKRESEICQLSDDEILALSRDEAISLLFELKYGFCNTDTELNGDDENNTQAPNTHSITTANVQAEKRDTAETTFDILSEFYDKAQGLGWADQTGWKSTETPFCTWFGIQCDESCSEEDVQNGSCPIVAIVLENNRVGGQFEELMMPLEKLVYLQYIDLSRNGITGLLVDVNIPYLLFLIIDYNNIRGTIPDFRGIPNLFVFSAVANPFTGSLVDFTNIPNLQVYFIGEMNTMSGTIPNFSNLPQLEVMYFSSCGLSGPLHDFDQVPLLKNLDVSNNHMEGTLPDFHYVPFLQDLFVTDNLLQGTLPPMQGIPSIASFLISYNDISGTIPDFSNFFSADHIGMSGNLLQGSITNFRNLPVISKISCGDNLLFGTLPDFSNLPTLKKLIVYNNNVTGSIPEFSSTPLIEILDLSGNKLTGSIPNLNLPNMWEINLFNNMLSGQLPDFSGMSPVHRMYISINKLNGTLPDFSSISNLALLDVSANKIQGTIPDFSALPILGTIDLTDNQLSGSVPDFKNIVNLQAFYASENNLTGSIPLFSSLAKLENIELYSNNLEGEFPALQSATIKKIDVNNNQIQGDLPLLINTPQLQYFDVSYNQLTGTLPTVFESWTRLQTLILSHNQFREPMPPNIWNLQNLVTVDLSHNRFQGDVGRFLSPPSTVDFTYYYQYLNLDDNQFFGKIDWWTFRYVRQLTSFSIRNNKISSLGELNVVSKWRFFDLTNNPIQGSIPESFSLFIRMHELGLRNTSMTYATNLLPHFLTYGDPFQLGDKSALFLCPSIFDNNRQSQRLDVGVDPLYYNHTFCECLPNYFGFRETCISCPRGCDCQTSGLLKNCFMSPHVLNPKSIIPCPLPKACIHDMQQERSNISTILSGDSTYCADGYQGRVCSQCQEGYGAQGRACHLCDDDSILLAQVAGPLMAVAFVIFLYKKTVNDSAKLSIILFHIQTLSIVSAVFTNSSEMNEAGDTTFSITSISFPALSCVIGSNQIFHALAFSYTRILIILTLASIFYLATEGVRKDKVVFIAINLFQLIYYNIAREVFGVFGCTLHDSGDGNWYSNVNPWIQCYPASDEYLNMLGISIVAFLGFVVLFPAIIWWVLDNIIQADHESYDRRYGFLYLPFAEDRQYWSLIILLRRISFSFVISVIPYTNPAVLFLSLAFIIQGSIWMQHRYRPFKHDHDNWLEMWSLYVIFTSFFLAFLASFLQDQDWLGILVIALNAVAVLSFITASYIIPIATNALQKKKPPTEYQLNEIKDVEPFQPMHEL
eukprot:TRINITY_DN2673_c0_g2_i3.p1 TRINITY_DN2673_c0_g2~~TRINITY_DN2673_c0_g2_i3.p1  ORF type:complete len:1310 (-),score=251.46 TRINITY_DN2673_c0_g2_i3:41-3970(-)